MCNRFDEPLERMLSQTNSGKDDYFLAVCSNFVESTRQKFGNVYKEDCGLQDVWYFLFLSSPRLFVKDYLDYYLYY